MFAYRLLKTFVQGETIKFFIDGVQYERIFMRVSNTHLILVTLEGTEEEIELDKINSVVL